MASPDLDDTWHVFHGIQLEAKSDIDHIVVGPGGFFCISTKNYRGLFSLGLDGCALYNNEPTALISDTLRQSLSLRDRLAALLGSDCPFVNAVLAVPQAFVAFNGPQQGDEGFIRQNSWSGS